MRSLVQAIIELLRSWWRVDRIRSSPVEGRLLRLQPPAFLVIEGRTIEITRRVAGQDRDGPFVVYDCLENGSDSRLLIRPTVDCVTMLVRWMSSCGERTIDDREVSVFQPAR